MTRLCEFLNFINLIIMTQSWVNCVLGTSVIYESNGVNSFVFKGLAATIPTQAEIIRVLSTLTYYNFNLQAVKGSREISIRVTTTTGIQFASAVFVTIYPYTYKAITCPSAVEQTIDVVLVLDSSATSSSPQFWSQQQTFASQLIQWLPISAQRVRFVDAPSPCGPFFFFYFHFPLLLPPLPPLPPPSPDIAIKTNRTSPQA